MAMKFDETVDQAEASDRESDLLWSPFTYTAELHRLLDQAVRSLSAAQQVLYLQFFRESFGRGQKEVSLTINQLRTKTGLSKTTIIKGIEGLRCGNYLVVLEPGGPKVPARYEVKVLTGPKAGSSAPLSIETRLTYLDESDRSLLLSLEKGLSADGRLELEERALSIFREIGFSPTPAMLRQAVLFQLLKDQMYHRIASKYPKFF